MKKTIKHPSVFRFPFYVFRSTIYVFRSTFYTNVLVLVLILTLFASCSKFEDGPKISLRSIEKRIYGAYRIEYFSKNGTDLTDYWNQYYDITFEFCQSDDRGGDPYARVYGSIDSLGYWKSYSQIQNLFLTTDDDVLVSLDNVIYDTTDYPNRIIYPLIIYVYDINRSPRFKFTRLTNTEIWMEHTYGNDIYEVHLKE